MSTSRSASVTEPTLGVSISELALLRDSAPDMYADLMREIRKDLLHRRWLAWSDVIAQTIGHLCGLTALVALVAVAWHSIDSGNATQGAAIITAGAAAIVAVFVTGRLAGPKRG